MTKSRVSPGELPGLSMFVSIDEVRWSARETSGRPVRVSALGLNPTTAKRLHALVARPMIHHPNLAALSGAWVRDRSGKLHELSLGRELAHSSKSDGRTATLEQAALDTGMPKLAEAAEWFVAALAPEKTILDRAEECGKQGNTGIPADELLGYLTDLASAVDFIHRIEPAAPRAHGIIHPQNLWLWGRTARLGHWERMFVQEPRDAALAEGADFAAPETRRQGELSPAADQYSLAACYTYLRTGQMPKQGARSSLLQSAEQSVLDRALSDDPNARYSFALDMVKALRGACGGETMRGSSIKTLMVANDPSKDGPSIANVPAPKPRAAKTVTMADGDFLSEIRQTCAAVTAISSVTPPPAQASASPPTPTPPAARHRAEQTVMMNSGASEEEPKKPLATAKGDGEKPIQLPTSGTEPASKGTSGTPARRSPETVVMDNFFVAGPAAGFLPPVPSENAGSAPPPAGSSGSQTVVINQAPSPGPSVTRMISAALDSQYKPATQTVRIDLSEKGDGAESGPIELRDDAPVNPTARTVRDIGNLTIKQDISPTAGTIHDVSQRAASSYKSPGEGDLLEMPKSGAAEPAAKPPLGTLGEYLLLEKLGGGTMGQVYKAMHRYMQRMVAIKVLTENLSPDMDSVQRFVREAETAARLTHPNIVTAYNAGVEGKQHYLVMEHVEGIDLFRTVDRAGPLALRTALEYTLQAARGLDYAHRAGIVHRDIKPGNLMLGRDGTVKILDMGLARFFEGSGDEAGLVTRTGTIMGTLDYMPPEQAKNSKKADQRSDIYSLGCTMFFLLTAQAPYPARTLVDSVVAHRDQPIPKLAQRIRAADAALVSRELQAMFERMMAKQPDDRFNSMKSVIGELEAVLAKLPVPEPVDPLSSTVITQSSGGIEERKGPPTVHAVLSNAPTVHGQSPNVPASSAATVVKSSGASAPTTIISSSASPAVTSPGTAVEEGLSKRTWQIIALIASAAAILQLVLRFV